MPTKKRTNTAFLKMAQAPLKPSPQLAEVLGSASPISQPQVAKFRSILEDEIGFFCETFEREQKVCARTRPGPRSLLLPGRARF